MKRYHKILWVLIIFQVTHLNLHSQSGCPQGSTSRLVKCNGVITEKCVPDNYNCRSCWVLQTPNCSGSYEHGCLPLQFGAYYSSYAEAENGSAKMVDDEMQKRNNGAKCSTCDFSNYRIYLSDTKICNTSPEKEAQKNELLGNANALIQRLAYEIANWRKGYGQTHIPGGVILDYKNTIDQVERDMESLKRLLNSVSDYNIAQIENAYKDLSSEEQNVQQREESFQQQVSEQKQADEKKKQAEQQPTAQQRQGTTSQQQHNNNNKNTYLGPQEDPNRPYGVMGNVSDVVDAVSDFKAAKEQQREEQQEADKEIGEKNWNSYSDAYKQSLIREGKLAQMAFDNAKIYNKKFHSPQEAVNYINKHLGYATVTLKGKILFDGFFKHNLAHADMYVYDDVQYNERKILFCGKVINGYPETINLTTIEGQNSLEAQSMMAGAFQYLMDWARLPKKERENLSSFSSSGDDTPKIVVSQTITENKINKISTTIAPQEVYTLSFCTDVNGSTSECMFSGNKFYTSGDNSSMKIFMFVHSNSTFGSDQLIYKLYYIGDDGISHVFKDIKQTVDSIWLNAWQPTYFRSPGKYRVEVLKNDGNVMISDVLELYNN